MFLTNCCDGHVPRNVLHALEGEVVLDEEVRYRDHVGTHRLVTVMRTFAYSESVGEGGKDG